MKEVLNPKLVARIDNIREYSLIDNISSSSMKLLTEDFKESYVRYLLSKFESLDEQDYILKIVVKRFDDIYIRDYWNNCPQYEVDPPSYFDDLRLDIETGVRITASADMVQQIINPWDNIVSTNTGQAESWSKTCKEVSLSLASAGDYMSKLFQEFQSVANNGLSTIEALRNGSIVTFSSRFEDFSKVIKELEAEKRRLINKYKELEAEKDRLKKTEEEWFRVRDEVIKECYDAADIREAGGVTDRDIFIEIYDGLLAEYARNKENKEQIERLVKERDELQKEREKWLRDKEYQVQIEKTLKESVSFSTIRDSLIREAGHFEKDSLRSFLNDFSTVLKGTGWDSISENVKNAVFAEFERKIQPLVKVLPGGTNIQYANNVSK